MTQEAINERRNDTAWLLGTNLDKAWRPRKEQWEEDWENAVRVMEKQSIPTESYSWDLYRWAATIFTSRSFISDPGLSKDNSSYAVLLPVIDLLNHRFPAKVNWFFDSGNFQFRTEEPVVKDQEIFNNYGGKGNEEHGPQNLKQQYAKIYRDGQMKILKENHKDVERLVEKANFVSLDDVVRTLKEEQEELGGKSWNQALEITFKTDDLASLREQGVEREAWILWLCAAWIFVFTTEAGNSSRISVWVNDLLESHPNDQSNSDSHLPIVIRQLRAHAGGIWQSPSFGSGLYHWASEVVDAEARMLAYLDENENNGKLLICLKDK
ncbi:hypothetical protein GTA08_BOTSDO11564 [Neofusicoccum parvum]|uniref:Uncharacterized protein n=1 Tax=Neofusicoccum parvum TaxID=310453 RepID=A0ACB5S4J8_9PEZI|nr:hypothetical protein GTA08_BOTSDO11564 [Neofusicoccum parvum]